MIAEAVSSIQEYVYRKEFGLSSEEFHNEPWDEYIVNSFIINQIAEINRRASKEAERQSKRR